MKKKKMSILGSTGSIGVSALDVVSQHKDRFEIVGLSAGSNIDLLKEQILEFSPKVVSVKDEKLLGSLKESVASSDISFCCGLEGVAAVATHEDVDLVLSAMVGSVGLMPTYKAIKKGKQIALANKEVLVAAGELVMKAAGEAGVKILPVDSEHSAIFQSIEGQRPEDINRIILTASGGPFWNFEGDLSKVRVEDALNHPNWSMGAKITIDSATMMNKGLEVIEACWLFDVPEDKIDVVIHPQSIVHSMVEYKDSSIIAQMGRPDMRGPISYALAYPERIENNVESIDWSEMKALNFSKPNDRKFPILKLVRDVIREGGSVPAVMNAANEVAVDAFLNKKIGFLDIYKIVAEVVENHSAHRIDTIEKVLDADFEGRKLAGEMVVRHSQLVRHSRLDRESS